MALTDERNGIGATMLVGPTGYGGMPMYGGGMGGFGAGGDWWGILLLIALLNGGFGGFGGWGFGGMGGMMWPMMMGGMGMGGFGLDYLYPWLNNSQHISDGFRDQQINSQLGDIRTDLNRGFGDVQLGLAGVNQNLCQTGNAITGAVRDGFYGAEISANQRQMANMQQVFGVQSALQDCCCENRAGIADLKYTVATENCADRTAAYQNTRDIIDNQNRVGQSILDKLCQLELDGYKQQVEAKNDQIGQLRSQLQFANMQASQVDQTAQLRANQATVANQLVSELRSCPIPAQPVYGNQPIFTCPQSYSMGGCGCAA
jgi:hypothetical protein